MSTGVLMEGGASCGASRRNKLLTTYEGGPLSGAPERARDGGRPARSCSCVAAGAQEPPLPLMGTGARRARYAAGQVRRRARGSPCGREAEWAPARRRRHADIKSPPCCAMAERARTRRRT